MSGGGKVQRITARIIFMIRDQQLVARSKTQGTQDRIDPRRGIGNADKIIARRAQELGQGVPRFVEQGR